MAHTLGEENPVTRRISLLLRRFPFIIRLPYLAFSRIQARYTIGVAAVIIDDRGRVLLVEHAYHPRYPWGLPGGWLDDDEEPAEAIKRELCEELELQVTVLGGVHIARTARNHIDLAFHCKALSPIGKLSHELLTYQWVALDQLPDIKRFHRQSIQAARNEAREEDTWKRV